MMMKMGSVVLVGLALGCASQSKPADSPPPTAASDDSPDGRKGGGGGGGNGEVCDALVKIARGCYDASANNSCESVRGAAARAAENTGLKPSVRDSVTHLCDVTCNARKEGSSWRDVEVELRKGCAEG
jgi:hypothetical protein